MVQNVDIFTVENVQKFDIFHPTSKDKDKDKSYTYDEALNVIGFGKFHFQILFLCGVVLMAVINETMGMSIIMTASQCDLELTSANKGILSAVSFLGIMVTSHMWGYLADTKGRKNIIIYTLLASNICSLGSSFANNFITMSILRFCVGLFISAPSSVIYAYLGEFNETRIRSKIISYACSSIGFGAMYISLMGWWMLSYNWSLDIFGFFQYRPWRLLIVLYALPGFIGAILMMFYPESPKFLLSQGREEEALEALRYINVKTHGVKAKEFEVKSLNAEEQDWETESIASVKSGKGVLRSIWRQTMPLFMPPHLLYFAICCILQFGLFLASAGMGLWFPELMNRLLSDINATPDAYICDILEAKHEFSPPPNSTVFQVETCNETIKTDVFIYNLTLGSIYAVFYFVISILLNKLGRGVILATSLFTSAIGGFVLVWVNNPTMISVLFVGYMIFAGVCISVVNGAAVVLFPTHVRAMAVCLSLMMGRLGSIVGSNLVGLLMEDNCFLTFNLFAGFILVCAMLTFFLPCR